MGLTHLLQASTFFVGVRLKLQVTGLTVRSKLATNTTPESGGLPVGPSSPHIVSGSGMQRAAPTNGKNVPVTKPRLGP